MTMEKLTRGKAPNMDRLLVINDCHLSLDWPSVRCLNIAPIVI